MNMASPLPSTTWRSAACRYGSLPMTGGPTGPGSGGEREKTREMPATVCYHPLTRPPGHRIPLSSYPEVMMATADVESLDLEQRVPAEVRREPEANKLFRM